MALAATDTDVARPTRHRGKVISRMYEQPRTMDSMEAQYRWDHRVVDPLRTFDVQFDYSWKKIGSNTIDFARLVSLRILLMNMLFYS